MRLTGGEALVKLLATEQVPLVTGIVGGKLAPVLRALSQTPSLPFIGTRHEGAAALMASGVYPATGRLGVVVAECGGGAGNIVPGIAVARANHSALLAITSNNQHAASYPERGMFAGLPTESLLRPITKWNCAIHDPRRLPELVRHALRVALSGAPGPVHLDIPQDVLRATVDFAAQEFPEAPSHYRPLVGPAADPSQLALAAQWLRSAERPLVIAGGGAVAPAAVAAVRALVGSLTAAACATQMGNGAIAAQDPHWLGLGWVLGGGAVRRACAEADVVLLVGCRLSSWLRGEDGPIIARGAKVIQIDIEPTVIGEQLAVGLGICADAGQALPKLAGLVRDAPASAARIVWLEGLGAERNAEREQRERTARSEMATDEAMHPAALARALSQVLPEDALAVLDGGHTTFWSNEWLPASEPRTRFNEPGMSQLGFGLPWALALKALHPERPVVHVTGDGAFGFTLQELDTARRYRLPVITVVHNNAAWGVIRHAYRHGQFEIGTDLAGTDYGAIARGFGCYGESVVRADGFAAAWARAIDSGLPAVLDCRVRFEPHPQIAHFARMSAAGA